MAIAFKHGTSGLIKECPEGFSWTTFFSNAWVPLLRAQWVPFIITMVTFGFAGLYYMFAINKEYAIHLMKEGYKPASDLDIDKIKMIGIPYSAPDAKLAPVEEAA